MPPLSRASDTRTTSHRAGNTTERDGRRPLASNSSFSKLVAGTILAALSVYLISFPGVALAIGAIVIGFTLFSIGPLLVFWILRGIQSVVPFGAMIRLIDLKVIGLMGESRG